MAQRINPFQELYLTESIGSERFVGLFSDSLVNHALPLFQPGHVVLMGHPGSGKSMLLNLLKPEVRIAYFKARKEFPIPSEFQRFIGAGINLKRSGASEFGVRPILSERKNLKEVAPIYFGDFINFWIVSDILNSIQTYISIPELAKEIGISAERKKLDEFAKRFSREDCLFDYFKGTKNIKNLKSTLSERITSYRSFFNHNIKSLSKKIRESKTTIGEPISRTVSLLREVGVISKNVQIFIRIDQYEELLWIEDFGSLYQQVVNKALGLRDSQVSYRIGTRPYSWPETPKIYGSNAVLEKERNYKTLDIDETLRRKENQRTWIFPEFAEDVFARRLGLAQYKSEGKTRELIQKVFGKKLIPREKAKHYVSSVSSRKKIILMEDDWPDNWKKFLLELAETDPFSAKLAEGWARQRGKGEVVSKFSQAKKFPWEQKIYWVKERKEQALMQIASRNRRQMIWSGKDDILALSGGNILTFLSLSQHIWDVWLRDTKGGGCSRGGTPKDGSRDSNYWNFGSEHILVR